MSFAHGAGERRTFPRMSTFESGFRPRKHPRNTRVLLRFFLRARSLSELNRTRMTLTDHSWTHRIGALKTARSRSNRARASPDERCRSDACARADAGVRARPCGDRSAASSRIRTCSRADRIAGKALAASAQVAREHCIAVRCQAGACVSDRLGSFVFDLDARASAG